MRVITFVYVLEYRASRSSVLTNVDTYIDDCAFSSDT